MAVNKAEAKHKAPFGLRTVALFELVKGLLVLVVGLALLLLLHTDVQGVAEDLVDRLHADPAWAVTHEFIKVASEVTDQRIMLVAIFATIYAGVRVVEAYGLWHERHWAEWFAVISAAIYLPLEVYHICIHPRLLGLTFFFANVAIVIYLTRLLAARHYDKKHERLARQSQAA
jgi:uncharacterized membrane protein (DUF2068 family)